MIINAKNYNLNCIPKINQRSFNTNNILFKGNDSFEITNSGDVKLIHQTAMFREPKTDEFVQNYIAKEFATKPEINIVSGACSSGEEVYGYACMLNDLGKKINITGFDISNEILESAKSGTIEIKKYPPDCNNVKLTCEGFLLDDSVQSGYLAECKKNFFKYFEPQSEKEVLEFPDSFCKQQEERYQNACKIYKLFQGSQLGSMIKNICDNPPSKTYEVQNYKFNQNLASNCCINFEYGNILKLDELFPENNKIDVFLYKNALYHSLCKMFPRNIKIFKPDAKDIMNLIAKEMNRIVSSGGLVIFGENEDRQGIEKNVIYNVMTENGFEPLYLSDNPESEYDVNIWRKAS